MIQRILFLLLSILANVNTSAYTSAPVVAATESAGRLDYFRGIRGASVMIMMQSPILHEGTDESNILGYGIGTLVRDGDRTFLVTHNHWGRVLQDFSLVEFSDPDNGLLNVILGIEFNRLILYQDAGTLVLLAPAGLADRLIPSSLDCPVVLAVGETVQVAYRSNPAQDQIAILDALVEGTMTINGLTAYQLRSLSGQTIQPGDSGGGVWYQGGLIGNNWTAEVEVGQTKTAAAGSETTREVTFTGISYAAALEFP